MLLSSWLQHVHKDEHNYIRCHPNDGYKHNCIHSCIMCVLHVININMLMWVSTTVRYTYRYVVYALDIQHHLFNMHIALQPDCPRMTHNGMDTHS